MNIGYLLESPVWKSTYRLVLSDPGAAGETAGETAGDATQPSHLLQGWGVVENTTEEDWTDVALTLVAGRPISFRMNVYQPLYVPRPLLQFETATAVGPRDYDAGLSAARSRAAPQSRGPPWQGSKIPV